MPPAMAALQPFSLYGSEETNLAGDMNILVGNKVNDFSFWVELRPPRRAGAVADLSRRQCQIGLGHADPRRLSSIIDQNGNPRFVGGANQADHSEQHLAKSSSTMSYCRRSMRPISSVSGRCRQHLSDHLHHRQERRADLQYAERQCAGRKCGLSLHGQSEPWQRLASDAGALFEVRHQGRVRLRRLGHVL